MSHFGKTGEGSAFGWILFQTQAWSGVQDFSPHSDAFVWLTTCTTVQRRAAPRVSAKQQTWKALVTLGKGAPRAHSVALGAALQMFIFFTLVPEMVCPL